MTSTSTYTYTSRAGTTPAEPVLASSLLQSTPTSTQETTPSGSSTASWNLATDIEKGLFPPSKDDVFHPGKVIGFSKLRGRLNEAGDDEEVGQFPRHLLTTWLSSHSNHQARSKRAYIIHPQTSNIFSPQSLLKSLLSHHQGQESSTEAKKKAISLLDAVTLFPVHDFASAIDAIHEISKRLSQEQEQEGVQDQQSPTENVLIIVGLDSLTDSIIRSSSALRGAAVLAGALRTVTGFSRGCKGGLSVLLVNTSLVGPSPYQSQANRTHNQPHHPQCGFEGNATGTTGSGGGSAAGIQSAFTAPDTNLFPSLLMKTLDQGVDTHLLLSRDRGENVVEVIKDRVGEGSGKWCVWPPSSRVEGVSR
ncbi:uncharacterized protein BDV14DRAFT_164854 [Aspergillus stella-maris]|uniref:uncharacterized protein n=1 Tax=Aspergillus stella-maris TaxID=1810926 RepID=UPI003CCCF60F